MKILFVCSANRQRSRTAQDHYRNAYKGYKSFEFESCGTVAYYVEATKKFYYPEAKLIDQKLVNWADRIVCMGLSNLDSIFRFKRRTKVPVVVLDFPDIYGYMQPALMDILSRAPILESSLTKCDQFKAMYSGINRFWLWKPQSEDLKDAVKV